MGSKLVHPGFETVSVESVSHSVVSVSNRLETLRSSKLEGRKLVFWGAGKRLTSLIQEFCIDASALPLPDYVVDSTREIDPAEYPGVPVANFEQLLNEDPSNTTIVITAGVLDLQAQIIKNELYYFDIMHIRSIETALYLLPRMDQLQISVELLATKESRNTYLKVLKNVVDGVFFDPSNFSTSAYFGNGISSLPKTGDLIFAGAFNGKHVDRFLKESPKLRILAFEPSPYWSKKLSDKYKSDSRVNVSNCLLGSNSELVNYDPDYENHGLAARIEPVASNKTVLLPVTKIDDFIESNFADATVVQISLDIEGAEQSALLGAERIIREFSPILTICLYHNPDDFVMLPQLIERLHPGRYSFQVLQHSTIQPIETVLYAVPNEISN